MNYTTLSEIYIVSIKYYKNNPFTYMVSPTLYELSDPNFNLYDLILNKI